VIIFSCVRTGETRGIGFLNDTRRLNVALTRAKCSLFVLGKAGTLVRNPIWRAMIEDVKERKFFIPYDRRFWDDAARIKRVDNLKEALPTVRERPLATLIKTPTPIQVRRYYI
jgi:hypothetical protein